MVTEGLSVVAQKDILRRNLRAIRHSLSNEGRRLENAAIQKFLLEWSEFKRASSLFVYLSTYDEAATYEIIKAALQDGKTVSVPFVTDKRRGLMECVRLTSLSCLQKGAYGIFEPALPTEMLEPKAIDLALVPGVAFSKCGARLGMGGGFYDRMLVQMPKTVLVGLAFSCQIIADIPLEAHDRYLDYLATAEGIYDCSGLRL